MMTKKGKGFFAASLLLNAVLLAVLAVWAVQALAPGGEKTKEEGSRILVLTVDSCEGTVVENQEGQLLRLAVSGDSGLPFSTAEVSLTEDTVFCTYDGTKIAVHPEQITGRVLVEFHEIVSLEGDTAAFAADTVYCSGG